MVCRVAEVFWERPNLFLFTWYLMSLVVGSLFSRSLQGRGMLQVETLALRRLS